MEDSRFARVSQDPRFKKISRKEKKLKIDGRFQKMFTDKEFTTKYFVDKRGSKVKKTSTEDLHKFYELSDESDEENPAEEEGRKEETVKNMKENKSKKKTKKELQESKDVDVGSSDKGVLKANETKTKDRQGDESVSEEEEEEDFARGEGDVESSSDEESEESISPEIQLEEVEHPWGEIDVSAKMRKDATKRLALCNIDWDRVTATDLYVLFNSFKPRDGIIQSIKIYPSEYGLEQIRKEECSGPVQLREEVNEGIEKTTSVKEGPGFSMEKLRRYQLNRLKYFYAVIECDCPETADILYEECDGTEFELSGNALDLRFVPDDMEFEHSPHSVATELPASGSYTAPEFNTTALHQTNVKLTWDETDPGRQRAMMRKFKKEDLLEMDFNVYLASSSGEDELEENGQDENDSSSEDEDKKMDKYKQLLKEIDDKEKKADRDQEIEITWEPGLEETREELVTRKIQEKKENTMTPWEKYVQAKKEKKKDKRMEKDASKKQLPGNTADDSDEIPSDVDLSDPFFTGLKNTGLKKEAEGDIKSSKSKNKGKRTDTETMKDKKTKDELELLLMDDKDDRQHFSLKGIMENEKNSKKKRKRKLKESEAVVDNFNVDLEDLRFDALFTSHHFAVDPSDPQYRKTKAMEAIIDERQKRRHETERSKNRADEKGSQSRTTDPSLSLLVKSVKSKTGQFHQQKKRKSKP